MHLYFLVLAIDNFPVFFFCVCLVSYPVLPGHGEADVLLEHAPGVALVPRLGVRLLGGLAVEREAGLHVPCRLRSGLKIVSKYIYIMEHQIINN